MLFSLDRYNGESSRSSHSPLPGYAIAVQEGFHEFAEGII